jgi:hypothetical protein
MRSIKGFNMLTKATVNYATIEGELRVGFSALVWPINHTSPWVSNKGIARTSAVVHIGENGEFETMNSIYKPIKYVDYEAT